jgi:hypothetical protein
MVHRALTALAVLADLDPLSAGSLRQCRRATHAGGDKRSCPSKISTSFAGPDMKTRHSTVSGGEGGSAASRK